MVAVPFRQQLPHTVQPGAAAAMLHTSTANASPCGSQQKVCAVKKQEKFHPHLLSLSLSLLGMWSPPALLMHSTL